MGLNHKIGADRGVAGKVDDGQIGMETTAFSPGYITCTQRGPSKAGGMGGKRGNNVPVICLLRSLGSLERGIAPRIVCRMVTPAGGRASAAQDGHIQKSVHYSLCMHVQAHASFFYAAGGAGGMRGPKRVNLWCRGNGARTQAREGGSPPSKPSPQSEPGGGPSGWESARAGTKVSNCPLACGRDFGIGSCHRLKRGPEETGKQGQERLEWDERRGGYGGTRGLDVGPKYRAK